MDDTLTHNLKLAELYGVPVPPYPMTPMQKWMVAFSSLNVRRGPGVEWNAIRYLKYGDIVTIISEFEEWAEIAPGEWCSKQYLRKV
jgi:uncharacterized protein YgiM (DUF1202 family)